MKIVTREEWGAAAPKGRLSPMRQARGFIVHHSAGTRRSLDEVKTIQRMHQVNRGWVDIGYNFLVTASGRVVEGRPEVDGRPVVGAHSPGLNSSRIGVCLLGDFREGHDHVGFGQAASLVDLCQWAAVRYGIRPVLITGHRDHRATECPGQRLGDLIGDIRKAVGEPFIAQLKLG